jgi:hypothetical protein
MQGDIFPTLMESIDSGLEIGDIIFSGMHGTKVRKMMS